MVLAETPIVARGASVTLEIRAWVRGGVSWRLA
jgi:hypothetical protein